MGFSPFSIESTDSPEEEPLGKSYAVLSQLTSIIGDHQGKNIMDGAWLDKNFSTDTIKLGTYNFTVKHDFALGWSPKAKEHQWRSHHSDRTR